MSSVIAPNANNEVPRLPVRFLRPMGTGSRPAMTAGATHPGFSAPGQCSAPIVRGVVIMFAVKVA